MIISKKMYIKNKLKGGAKNPVSNYIDKKTGKKKWQQLFPELFTDFASSSTSAAAATSSKKSATSPGNLHNLKPSFIYEITDATGATKLSMYSGPSREVEGKHSFLRLNLAQEKLRYRFDSQKKTFTDTNSKNFNIEIIRCGKIEEILRLLF